MIVSLLNLPRVTRVDKSYHFSVPTTGTLPCEEDGLLGRHFHSFSQTCPSLYVSSYVRGGLVMLYSVRLTLRCEAH